MRQVASAISAAASRHSVALEIIRTGSRGLYWLEPIIAMEFCAIETRGKCTPCRVGSTQGMEVIDHRIRGENRVASTVLLEDFCTTPVAEGMVVRTKSERLDRLRKGVMELYVSDHPVDSLNRTKYADIDLLETAEAVRR